MQRFFHLGLPGEQQLRGGGNGTYSSYAYVANATTGTLAGFPVPTATFTTLTGTTYTLGTTPFALAATPKGTFLYVATLQWRDLCLHHWDQWRTDPWQ